MPLGIPHSQFLDWSIEDQDKALAFLDLQALKCGNCGTMQSDWDEDRFAYVSEHRQCPGCELLETEYADNVPEGSKGTKVYLIPRAVAERMAELEDAAMLGAEEEERAQQ